MQRQQQQQGGSEAIEVGQFDRMPYLGVLTYPRPDLRAARSRLKQLRELGVGRVVFEGRTRVGRLGLVGLGTVSIVVKGAARDGSVQALKIRRTDANRASMEDEFKLTQTANRGGVGAPVYACTRDFILMEYVRGKEFEDYVRGVTGRGSARRVRETIHALLNQCRKLDLIGLDHGQLSDIRKHVIVGEDGMPCVIDFESASRVRVPKNVTTAGQYLLVGSRLSRRVRRILSVKEEPSRVVEALRRYKRDMSDENYVRVLATFGVII